MRAISRVAGASINTVSKLLVDAGLACAAYHDEHVRGLKSKRVQADEVWSFYYAKDKNVPEAKKGAAGSVWTWTALDPDSKLMCGWYVGSRDAECAGVFMKDLAERLASRVQLTTDGHKAYLQAVDDAFGTDIDYAMLIKIYGESADQDGPERKYSPGVCLGTKKEPIMGRPDKAKVSTSHVERTNLGMRMHMKRFARLSNAHSKKFENHCHAIALYFCYYNFVKINSAVRTTPAMAAGIETKLWEMEDLVRMIDDYHRPQPKFTVLPLKDRSGYYVLMNPNAYAPELHIDGFSTEAEAKAWVETESGPWFQKLARAREGM